MNPENPPSEFRDLVRERVIDAPPDKLFRAGTEPALRQQWCTPRPCSVAERKTREDMGVHQGWTQATGTQATGQLAALAATL